MNDAPDRRLWQLWREGERPDVRRFLAECGPLPPGEVVAALLVDQRERWTVGERVPAEGYLSDFPEVASDAERALELVYGEFLLREELGESPDPDEYLHRFPPFAERLSRQFRLHRAMASAASASDRDTLKPDQVRDTMVREGLAAAGQAGLPEVPGYDVLELLGRGAMGNVYRAWQHGTERLVALKMIRPDGDLDEGHLGDRFRTEGLAVARLQHPNIVQVHEVGESGGRPFLVMELLDGGTLAAKLGGVPLPSPRAAELVEALARAVGHAHERGVIHRDLKPQNVLLAADGTPKVADFGLAKILAGAGARRTETGAVLGTPQYMAPEQADPRKPLTPAADVHALGAILYECLTGRPPFLGETTWDTLRQVVADEPVPPSRLNPKVPRDLESVCLKCLSKEPDRRYAGAGGLADDLRRFLEGRPTAARPVGLAERGWRWCRRNRAVAGLLAAVAVVLVLGAAVSTGFGLHAMTQEGLARSNESNANLARAAAETEKDLKAHQLMTTQLLRVAACEADPSLAGALLHDDSACPRGLRDASWAFFERYVSRWELAALHGHAGGVWAVAYSPDGLTAATGSGGLEFTPEKNRPGEVRLWDASTGRLKATLAGHADAVVCVAFSRDGRALASGSADGTVRLWDPATGELKATLAGHPGTVWSVAFSPDGRTLAAGCGLPDESGEVKLWQVATGLPEAPLAGHADVVTAVAFGPDGLTLASGSADQTIKLWDVKAREARATLEGHTDPGGFFSLPTDKFIRLGFSPDGTTLASGGKDGVLRLWDVKSGRLKSTTGGHDLGITSVAYSPDGAAVATGSWDKVRLWDARTGGLKVALGGHMLPVSSVAFSPDGRALLSGS